MKLFKAGKDEKAFDGAAFPNKRTPSYGSVYGGGYMGEEVNKRRLLLVSREAAVELRIFLHMVLSQIRIRIRPVYGPYTDP